MLRLAARSLFSRAAVLDGSRAFGTSAVLKEEATSGAAPASFLAQFEKFAPSTLNPPNFNSDWAVPKPEVEEGATPDKLTFNFLLPDKAICRGEQVDMASIPGTAGDMGVLPGHEPVVAQLRPGVIEVHTVMDKEVKKYFVSSGYAFVHPDSSADVCAVEAVPVEDLDAEAVKAGLTKYTAELAAAEAKGDEYEVASATIGVEVYSAMSAAL